MSGNKNQTANNKNASPQITKRASTSELCDGREPAWRKRLARNRLAIYTTIYCLSLEIPFQRYLFKESRSLLVARCRFLYTVLILCRLIASFALSDCDYAHWRGHLYDWSIYYPVDKRGGIIRTYIGMLAFHVFFKISVFYYKRKRFDASLVDYLCREPPKHLNLDYESDQHATKAASPTERNLHPNKEPQSAAADSAIGAARFKDSLEGHGESMIDVRSRSVAVHMMASDFLSDDNGGENESDHQSRRRSQLQRSALMVKDSLYLRDRSHWFELSDLVWRSFRWNAWLFVSICAVIVVHANRRLAFQLTSERTCDIEVPLLRLSGLMELNFAFIESIQTLVGSFTYCSLVKDDLMLQARRVEEYLSNLVGDIEQLLRAAQGSALNRSMFQIGPDAVPAYAGGAMDVQGEDARDEFEAEEAMLIHSLSSGWAKSLDTLASTTTRSGTIGGQYEDESGARRRIERGQLMSHHQSKRPVARARQIILPPGQSSKLAAHRISLLDAPRRLQADSVCAPASLACPTSSNCGGRRQGRRHQSPHKVDGNKFGHSTAPSPASERHARQYKLLTGAIVKTQHRMILFLSCFDSHKPAISFIGVAFLFWMLTSLSFVPLLALALRTVRATRKQDGGAIYIASCIISLSTGLMFTLMGSSVHKRATKLTGWLFRICSMYHSRAETARWNKILMIWYCPSRCAFNVSGLFKLTYLNVLKTISFLVSGLTLILNYMSG